ncbi:MAG: hypothetical protein FJY88_08445 [Candidatus Eisenbacteria bacterium]|nr:hypothetical protein [Candidatus Eisenbacteria bacterium]
MKHIRSIPLAAFALPLCMVVVPWASRADQTYLSVTFDDKEIDAPLGTGGTAIGEATWIGDKVDAIVRSTPFPTPCLEVHDTDVPYPHNLGFELPTASVSTGLVVIIMDLWYEQVGESCQPYIELYPAQWQALLRIRPQNDGTITLTDLSGTAAEGIPCPTGRPLPILVAFDMDAGTYSAWLDGSQVVADRAHGNPNRNFYRVLINTSSGTDPDCRFWIDQIRVIDWMPSVPTRATTWGTLRALFRD